MAGAEAGEPGADERASPGGGAPPLAALLPLLALALALGLAALHGRVLLDDEVGTWKALLTASGKGWGALFTRFDEWLTQPAYFHLAFGATELFGASELAMRLPALAAALAGIAGLAYLGAALFSPRVGLVAALLLALHPYHVFYSQMARGYTLATASVTISLLLVVALRRGAGVHAGLGYVPARALGIYAHLSSCGTVLAELVLGAARPRESGRLRIPPAYVAIALAALAAILLYLPMVEGMLAFQGRYTGHDRGGFGFDFLPLLLTTWAGGPGLRALLFLAVAGLGLGVALRRAPRAGAALLLWPLGILAFYAVQNTGQIPFAYSRFLSPALPAALLACAVGLDALAGRIARGSASRHRALAGVLVAGFLVSTSAKVVPIAFGPRDTDWPAVFERIEREGGQEVTAIVQPFRFNAARAYYSYPLQGEPPRFEALWPAQLVRALQDRPPGWLDERRLAFLVDLVPFEAPRWRERFEVSRHGPTTLLLARPDAERSRAEKLASIRAVLEQVVRYAERLPSLPIEGDWVYWRIHPRHEHALLPTFELWRASRSLAALAVAEGEPRRLRQALAQVRRYGPGDPPPSEVSASWALLLPRFLVDAPGGAGGARPSPSGGGAAGAARSPPP